MSLNGLEDPKVQEALESATAEPGGWFILKYMSRDEIGLLGKGNGGIAEAQSAVAAFEEASPLYGFLKYRRRNVIVKYMPEDCSRLLQARATVHFNAVCDRLSPYDTTFEITTADDLKDSKLSAACALHTASGSTSSSASSQRRKRLGEIAEEDEEEQQRERKRQSIVQEEEIARPTSSAYSQSDRPPSSSAHPPVVLDPKQVETVPQETDFASTEEPPTFNGLPSIPTSPSKSDYERRLSTQTARPDLYSYATYTYGRPKVKLGPRPSQDTHKRPSTAGNYRPTAALPVGFKSANKGAKKDKIEEQDGEQETSSSSSLAPAVQEPTGQHLDIINTPLPPRPSTSSGASIISSASTIMASSGKDGKMTPEKARLMKAMKLREKKKRMTVNPVPSPISPVSPADTITTDELASVPAESSIETVAETTPVEDEKSTPVEGSVVDDQLPTPLTIRTTTQSEDTCPDSHPPSPTAGSSSEVGDSTKASSLSDSVDEAPSADLLKPPPPPSDSGNTTDGPDELSEIVEEAGLRMSAVDISEELGGQEAGKVDKQEATAEEEAEEEDESEEGEEKTISPEVKSNASDKTDITPKASDFNEKKPSDIRTTEITLPSKQVGGTPVSSPRVIPTSKFSTSVPQTPTTPKNPSTPNLKSKFSAHDIGVPTEPLPSLPSIIKSQSGATPNQQEAGVPATDREVVEPAEPEQPAAQSLESTPILSPPPRSARRKVAVDPIQTDVSQKTPQSELTSPVDDDDDEALIEELQSATVHEARPIMVSKSPMTPGFPGGNSPSKADGKKMSPQSGRAASNPMRGAYLAPGDVSASSARSVSAGGAAYLHNITRNPSNASIQSKKGNIGSSISQRIKALEQLSSNGPEESRARAPTPSSTFYGVRNQTGRQASKSPSVADRASSVTRNSPTPEPSREGTPETPEIERRNRSGSTMANRLTMFEGPAPRGRPDSIQVTARIIRDAPSTSSTNRWKRNSTVLDRLPSELKESPLTVDMQQHAKPSTSAGIVTETSDANTMADISKESLQEKRLSGEKMAVEEHDTGSRRRSSVSLMRSLLNKPSDNNSVSAGTAATSTPNSARSPNLGSGRSSMSWDRENHVPSPPGRTNSGILSDSESNNEDTAKPKNRTSRFMRRLSHSLTAGGNRTKTGSANISPTVAEETNNLMAQSSSLAAATAASRRGGAASKQQQQQPSIAAYMGDVNVQFPENLLWKRRSMCLDSHGWLLLSAVPGSTTNGKDWNANAGAKRYHMGEFRQPYAPDVEVQELPNSVVLDLVEGSCLQIACEDRHGQSAVLEALRDAHKTHSVTKP